MQTLELNDLFGEQIVLPLVPGDGLIAVEMIAWNPVCLPMLPRQEILRAGADRHVHAMMVAVGAPADHRLLVLQVDSDSRRPLVRLLAQSQCAEAGPARGTLLGSRTPRRNAALPASFVAGAIRIDERIVLYVHGGTFPSALSIAHRFDGESWRDVQEKGRFEVFEGYHLWVGEITADTAPPKGLAVEEERFDATETGKPKVVTVTELEPREESALGAKAYQLGGHLGLRAGTDGVIEEEVFESIYHPGKLLLLASWRDAESAKAWTPTKPDAAASLRHRHVRVIRDYGMFDRREAPQFYPEVKRASPAPEARCRLNLVGVSRLPWDDAGNYKITLCRRSLASRAPAKVCR